MKIKELIKELEGIRTMDLLLYEAIEDYVRMGGDFGVDVFSTHLIDILDNNYIMPRGARLCLITRLKNKGYI